MKYLYGDSTPFPLVENFLITLSAATEACAAILRADQLVEEGTRQLKESEAKVNQELARLTALARRVEETFGAEPTSGVTGNGSRADAVAARISDFAMAALTQARAEVLAFREAAVVSATRSAPHALVLPALGAFLVKHQLPETIWSLKWRALEGAPCAAEVYSRASGGIEGTYDVEVPQTHLWARPVRVSHFEKEATIQLTRRRWLREAAPCPERLDKLFITSVVHTPERAAMTLSRSPSQGAPSVEIVVRSGESTEMTAISYEREGQPAGAPEQLSAEDAATVLRLWSQVETTICELVCYRTRLTSAMVGGTSVGEIAQPEVVAKAIVDSIAHLVREIAARSSNGVELSLKRQISDGRREELFIPRDALFSQIHGLSERHQALFEGFGLRSQSQVVVRKPPPLPRVPQLKVVGA